MRKIIIFGGKGTAINIADHIVDAANRFGEKIRLLGFAIDDPSLGNSINGYPVLCKTNEVAARYTHRDVEFIFALYKPERMKERVAILGSYGIDPSRFASFVHPSCYVSASARIGRGTVILSHCSINANVTLGNFNIVNSSVVVEHDSSLANYVFVAAGTCIGANVHIKDGAFLGLKSTIREQLTIGNYAFIGMGSNVLRDVSDGITVYGNPARMAYDPL
jgi:sugar O-acyltransferase (sialic acid O-acetyltransferase NeuD family)